MEQTLLLQVKNLERFIQKHGEDMFFAKTISKMLTYKLDKYEEDIKRLDKYLRKYEHSYKKDSATFLKEFNKGMLGDDMAFIEWASVYQMRNRIEKKKSALENLIR